MMQLTKSRFPARLILFTLAVTTFISACSTALVVQPYPSPDEVVWTRDNSSSPEPDGGSSSPTGDNGGSNTATQSFLVYNALISVTGTRTTRTLVLGSTAKVYFFVGPNSPDNVINVDAAKGHLSKLDQTVDTTLSVTLMCDVCQSPLLQKQIITLKAGSTRSSKAVFEVTPAHSDAKMAASRGALIFDISHDGSALDHIVVPIAVSHTKIAESSGEKSTTAFLAGYVDRHSDFPSDLTISVRTLDTGRVQVSFFPENPRTRATLGNRYMGSDGKIRWFDTGVNNLNDLNAIAADAYLKIRQVTESLEPNPPAVPTKQDVAAGFGKAGAKIHFWLFDRDSQLQSIISAVEDSSSRASPLRIQIETDGSYIPWQILHRPGNLADATLYWGYKFELAVNPVGTPRDGLHHGSPLNLSDGAPSPTPDKRPTLLLRYHRNSASNENPDVVSRFSDQLKDYFVNTIGAPQISVIETKGEFIQQLREAAPNIELVFAFTHASSGTVFVMDGAGDLVPEKTMGGPRLILDSDSITADDISDLLLDNPYSPNLPPFLAHYPVVFLNGCESGTGGISPTTSLDLPSTWLTMGARSVVATEAPVDAGGALIFGEKFIDASLSGVHLTQALHEVRRDFLDQGGLFSLLYSYYGDPNATVSSVRSYPPPTR